MKQVDSSLHEYKTRGIFIKICSAIFSQYIKAYTSLTNRHLFLHNTEVLCIFFYFHIFVFPLWFSGCFILSVSSDIDGIHTLSYFVEQSLAVTVVSAWTWLWKKKKLLRFLHKESLKMQIIYMSFFILTHSVFNTYTRYR